MAEQKESSVLFSLKELMSLEEDRIKQEDDDKKRKEQAEVQARLDAERRAREAEEARLASDQERRRQEELEQEHRRLEELERERERQEELDERIRYWKANNSEAEKPAIPAAQVRENVKCQICTAELPKGSKWCPRCGAEQI